MDSAIFSVLPSRCSAVVVMGVSGCGKSSVAAACADALGWAMREGDSSHSPQSIAKMRAGLPLDDADRAGWLDRLAGLLAADAAASASAEMRRGTSPDQAGPGMLLTCSALRRRYRDQLRAARRGLGFVFLQLDYAAALQRVRQRPDHLFPPTLVASQFDTLESPEAEEGVLTVDATAPLAEVVALVLQHVHAAWSLPGQDSPAAPWPSSSSAHSRP